jgi:hypothetical protein
LYRYTLDAAGEFDDDVYPPARKARSSFDGARPPPMIPGSPDRELMQMRREPRRSVGSIDTRRASRASRSSSMAGRNSASGIDAAEKLEILTMSLRLHIEEQSSSEKTAQMLGTLTALNDLCRKQLAATVGLSTS